MYQLFIMLLIIANSLGSVIGILKMSFVYFVLHFHCVTTKLFINFLIFVNHILSLCLLSLIGVLYFSHFVTNIAQSLFVILIVTFLNKRVAYSGVKVILIFIAFNIVKRSFWFLEWTHSSMQMHQIVQFVLFFLLLDELTQFQLICLFLFSIFDVYIVFFLFNFVCHLSWTHLILLRLHKNFHLIWLVIFLQLTQIPIIQHQSGIITSHFSHLLMMFSYKLMINIQDLLILHFFNASLKPFFIVLLINLISKHIGHLLLLLLAFDHRLFLVLSEL